MFLFKLFFFFLKPLFFLKPFRHPEIGLTWMLDALSKVCSEGGWRLESQLLKLFSTFFNLSVSLAHWRSGKSFIYEGVSSNKQLFHERALDMRWRALLAIIISYPTRAGRLTVLSKMPQTINKSSQLYFVRKTEYYNVLKHFRFNSSSCARVMTCSQLSNFPKVDRTVNASFAFSFVLKLMKDILIVRSFLNLIVKW